MLRLLSLTLLLTFSAALSGCMWMGIDAAEDAGYDHTLTQVVAYKDVSLKTAYEAASEAVEDLELDVKRESVDELTGQIAARTADRKDVTITLDKQSAEQTKIAVQVGSGLLKSEGERAVTIMKTIEENL